MELPFLKNKNKQAGGAGVVERKSESKSNEQMLEMVAGEMLDAYDRKDTVAMRQAIKAFVLMINDEDEAQDAG